jgi:hypothetical protein
MVGRRARHDSTLIHEVPGTNSRRCAHRPMVVGLVAAGSLCLAGGMAGASSAGGVSVQDATFLQGTGIQQIDISIGGPAVGTMETLVLGQYGDSRLHWLVGVSADQITGGSCTYDVGQWQCAPGRSGWGPGLLHVAVNTDRAMDCGDPDGYAGGGGYGGGGGADHCMDALTVQSVPGGSTRGNGPPSGQSFTITASVQILPEYGLTRQPTAPTSTPSEQVRNAHSAGAPTAPRKAASPSAPAASHAAAVGFGAATTPDVHMTIDAVDTSVSTGDASQIGLYLVLGILALGSVTGPLGLRAVRRRRGHHQPRHSR